MVAVARFGAAPRASRRGAGCSSDAATKAARESFVDEPLPVDPDAGDLADPAQGRDVVTI